MSSSPTPSLRYTRYCLEKYFELCDEYRGILLSAYKASIEEIISYLPLMYGALRGNTGLKMQCLEYLLRVDWCGGTLEVVDYMNITSA